MVVFMHSLGMRGWPHALMLCWMYDIRWPMEEFNYQNLLCTSSRCWVCLLVALSDAGALVVKICMLSLRMR